MASYWNEPSMSRPALLRKKERNYVNHFCRRQRVFSVYCSFQVCVSKTLQSIMCLQLSCSPQMALTICKVSLRDTLCRCGFYLLILVLPKSGCWSPSFLSVSSIFFYFSFFPSSQSEGWNCSCCQQYLHIPRSWLCAFSCPSKYRRLYPLQSLFMPMGHMGSWSDWLCFTSR